MIYSRVYIDAIGYELPPVVVTSAELETRLGPVYEALHIPAGQLEALTGIVERRWWDPGYPLSRRGDRRGAARACGLAGAGRRARRADLRRGLPRAVRAGDGLPGRRRARRRPDAAVYDVSNACLGVLNGMVDIANRIELGQIRAGLVVSCETAREINDIVIERDAPVQDDGPVQVLAGHADRRLGGGRRAVDRRLVLRLRSGGGCSAGPCRRPRSSTRSAAGGSRPSCPGPGQFQQFTATDSAAVLKHGVELGAQTWEAFLRKLGWVRRTDRQGHLPPGRLGAPQTILKTLGIARGEGFLHLPYLGNIGTVSLPLTAALAEDRDFLQPGDRVAFLGIGSGLNCLMLGLEW